MHRNIILLTCTCAAYANLFYNEDGRRLVEIPTPKDKDLVPEAPSLSAAVLIRPRPLKPKDADNWNAPEYSKALDNIDDAAYDIKHFVTLDDKNINFIAIMYTIGRFTKQIAEDGWRFYDDNYAVLSKSCVETAKADPQMAIAAINCFMNAAELKIETMRRLMENKWVKHVCAAKPGVCDAHIFSIIKMSNDTDMSREADLLLVQGLAASKYMKIARRIHEWSLTEHLQMDDLMHYLRPLLAVNSVVHKMVFRGEQECYQ